MRKVLCILSVLLFLQTQSEAKHIIGGVLTYECLGNGDYEFTMKVYRDCNCRDCANFDQLAPISIYNCGPNNPCSNLGQNDPIYRLLIPFQGVTSIPEPDYPCLIPPDVCVEEGLYKWKLSEYNISLPLSNDSYHVVYQRCCRNETISNLRLPGDQGATFAVEITPAGQRDCNTTPIFNEFPPIIICNGQPLEFDHSAFDADGDQLVYEFCSPIQGGGPIRQNVPQSSCNGSAPNPPCPPPFNAVNFIVPNYTGTQPMAGNPVISINSQTGLITGVPEIQGQFVVGVCVTEYRNGVPLSRVIRDFQFNVANCDPTIIGRVEADSVSADGKTYTINSCGDPQITIFNQSFQQRFIDEHLWQFNINNNLQNFTQWSPTINFPGVGTYNGQLMLNPGKECGDTINIVVNVFPEVTADFSYDYDTCIAGTVQFTDLSIVPSGEVVDYDWRFGDGNFSDLASPGHEYRIAGNLPVNFSVTDVNSCTDEITKIISYFPVPRLIVISPSAEKGCEPLEVFFDNLSYPINNNYDILWDFGDGNTSGEISPTHIYDDPGIFTVSVDITSPIGCKTDTTFQDLIEVEASPIAGFDYSPKELNTFQKTVEFYDESIDAFRWYWNFNEEGTANFPNPTYTFRDTGTQVVRLEVLHPSGCRDTAYAYLDIRPEVRFYLPNAFTPNNDSKNEDFKGVGFMDGIKAFNMSIWNRWGELIFETNDPQEGWNGNKFNTGKPSPNGVYVVLVQYIDPRGEQVKLQGTATLVR
jgi:gliding motility-associated-like protein